MSDTFAKWIEERGVAEVECLVPDMNGVLRGKVLPAAKFIKAERKGALRMPSSVFAVTMTGDYAGERDQDYQDPDTHRVQVADGGGRLMRRFRLVVLLALAASCSQPHEVSQPQDVSSPDIQRPPHQEIRVLDGDTIMFEGVDVLATASAEPHAVQQISSICVDRTMNAPGQIPAAIVKMLSLMQQQPRHPRRSDELLAVSRVKINPPRHVQFCKAAYIVVGLPREPAGAKDRPIHAVVVHD